MIDSINPTSEERISKMKLTGFLLTNSILLLAAAVTIWGCANMFNEKTPNQAPTVNFVNTPQDANPDSSTSSWVLNMPFTLFGVDTADGSIFSLYDEPYQLVQFPELIVWGDTMLVTLVPDSPIVIKYYDGVDTTFYEEGLNTDYSILDSSTLIIQVHESGGMRDTLWRLVDVIELADTMIITGSDTDLFAIDTLVYFADFKLNTPNFYVFSFAPVIYWYGTDPDGFVEYYEYADIDENYAPQAITDPEAYKSQIPPSKWQTTNTTFTTIYLLSAAGDTTQHVLYLRCYDNDGLASTIKYRTFFRSNQAPNTPEIKWDEQQDTEYDTLNYIAIDDIKPADPALAHYDTLYCLTNVTPIWNGIILRWRGDDPDDRELYTIPLNYMYYLMKADSAGGTIAFDDTLWDWSMDEYTDEQSITFADLETGWYKFSVWSYDDGFERSNFPAELYFRCVKPTFEHSILIYDETVNMGAIGELPGSGNAQIDTFYQDMLYRLEPYFSGVSYRYNIDDPFDIASGTQDVIYWNNSTSNVNNLVPAILLSRFKMILFYAEDHKTQQSPYAYVLARDEGFLRYLNTGGRIWVLGRCLLNGSFSEGVGIGNSSNPLLNAMQVTQRYATRIPNSFNQPYEFVGAINAVSFLDTLSINSTKTSSLFFPFPQPTVTGGLYEIDWVARDEDATTLYYFNSITGQLSYAPRDTFATVLNWTDQPPYAAPNGYQCWLSVPDDNVISVSSVYNMDKNQSAEVINVTGNDEILVSYAFVPLQVVDENSQVLNASSSGGNYTNPTPTGCFIRTERYDQIFSEIYNVTRNSYAVAVSYPQFDVQVNYPDTIVTLEPGHFDYTEPTVSNPTSNACTITVEKNFVDNVLEIRNVTLNAVGTLISRSNNVLQVSYTSAQWSNSDSIVVRYTYHQYWEVGDSLRVDYMSDHYWEKGDVVEISYTFNPVTEAHLKPCAIRYEYFEIYNYTFYQLYYRAAIFTFPMYFMQNDTIPGQNMGKVDKVFYEMLDWFLDPAVHLGE